MNYDSISIKIFAIIAIAFSSLGLLLSLFGLQFMAIASFGMLCWGSIIGFQLSKYTLDQEESKKVFFSMLITIGVTLLAFFFGKIVGFIAALLTLSSTYRIKKNYDDWNERFPKQEDEINDHLIE
jgi:hypothetical protein